MEKERLSYVDKARGIAIILVVMGHVVSSYHETALYESGLLFNFTNHFVYSFHMPFFMLISGYLCALSKSQKSRGVQVKRKLLNYGIPYVLFSALWVGMKMLLASMTNSAVSFKDLFMIPLYPISFMWFIYALLIMQVVQILVGETRSVAFKIGHLILAGGGVLHKTIIGGFTGSGTFFRLRTE